MQEAETSTPTRTVVMAGGLRADDLKNFIDRIENLETRKRDVSEDIKAVKAEAKHAGFDPKTITELVKRRAADPRKLEEQEILLDLYERAVGRINEG